MHARHLTPILNVSDLAASFRWFEALGWRKLWDWGDPPTFGAVGSGECEIFLCRGGQGHRQSPGAAYDEQAATWMSVWVDNVDAIHATCLERGLEITWPPTDEPWGVREMHVRHPDGHIFRISQSLVNEDCDET